MMFEAIEIINKLFTGNVVKHKGEHFTLESAKLYTRPETPVPIYVATAGPVNAKQTGKFADGMITVGAADEKIGMLWGKFDEGAREAGKDPTGTPKLLQIHVSWAPTDEEAIENAMREWPNGGMAFPKQDIKNPEDFAAMAKLVRPEHFTNRVLMTSRPRGAHRAHPALRRHGLRRGPPPQRRPQPGRVHRGLRPRGAAEPAPRLATTARRWRQLGRADGRGAAVPQRRRLEADARRRVAVEHVDRVDEPDLLGLVGHHQRVGPRAAAEEPDALEQVARA